MKYGLSKISFDVIFKFTLLIFIAYFLILLTNISKRLATDSEVGRYQFHPDNPFILDTKTGVVKRYSRPQ